MKVEIKEFDVRLSEIVEDIFELFTSAEVKHPRSIREKCEQANHLYDKLHEWTLSLPPRLRVEDAALPRAILLQ